MPLSKRKRLKPGERITLSLPLAQIDLIVERNFIDADLLAMLHAAKVQDGVVVARCTLDDVDALAGYIAVEANNTKDKKLQKKLDAIAEAIQNVAALYGDDSSPN